MSIVKESSPAGRVVKQHHAGDRARRFARTLLRRPPDVARPPGPPLPKVVQGILFVVRPLELVEACRRRYGGIFTLRLPVVGRVCYLSDVELIGEVFAADATIMHAGEANSILEPVTGPRSVLVLDEDEHLRHRRMLLPPLHGQALQSYAGLITGIATRHIGDWPTAQPICLRPRLQAITLEIITGAIFGEAGSTRAEELRVLLDRLFDLSAGKILLLGLQQLLSGKDSPPRIRRTRAAIDRLLVAEIERRRGKRDGSGILSLLLDARDEQGEPLSDAEICDELVTLLLAGHETTATALAWTFERLVRHQPALGRLRRELTDGEHSYLDATLNESLRVRPVVMDVGRRLAQPIDLGGYRLPTGSFILPSIALVHSSGEHHDQPADFRPERFLDTKPSKSVWLPFGGGPRRCLGAAFAMLEMKLLVALVLERYTITATRPEDEPARLRGITLTPARDCEVILEPRDRGAADKPATSSPAEHLSPAP
jgi:cytochrome P450